MNWFADTSRNNFRACARELFKLWKKIPSEKTFWLFPSLFPSIRRHVSGTRTRQSAWRRFHQRPTAALAYPLEDRGACGRRRSAMSDLATIASLSRLCIEDLEPLSGKTQESSQKSSRNSFPSPHAPSTNRKREAFVPVWLAAQSLALQRRRSRTASRTTRRRIQVYFHGKSAIVWLKKAFVIVQRLLRSARSPASYEVATMKSEHHKTVIFTCSILIWILKIRFLEAWKIQLIFFLHFSPSPLHSLSRVCSFDP